MNAISISQPGPSGDPPRGLHVHAVLTAGATLFLIFVGALVTSHDAGLAVPDWPTTYDENLFVYPPSKWVGGIFYEHGHRLTASAVGLLTLVLALRLGLSEARKRSVRRAVRWAVAGLAGFSLLRLQDGRLAMSLATNAAVLLAFEVFLRGAPEPRRWVRGLGYAALFAVCLQGLLGGLTVHLLLPLSISVAHGCLAQAFLCLAVGLAVVTSPGWRAAERSTQRRSGRSGPWRLCALTAAVVYGQLFLGALVRHKNAGLAIPDFPLAFGRLVPPLDSGAVLLHFAHRIGALLVSAFLLVTAVRLLRHRGAGAGLKLLAGLVLLLLGLQLTLGAFAVWTRLAPLPTSLHVVTGAAILGISVLLALRSYQRLALLETPA
jgi:cytochrome c oxidase assembly protein subunit 15